ncbi:hypothetical protein PFBG_03458 [Plasmodium falciparum 7G8]|uniref:Uncharacterized protein n=1 Tax=Plasmodium falciparum (isolate 7G8) TaxID=57266 RepID=W7F5X6_PLAF8|nr:hypothetical protein PFBG_03458 [Plasmodium falciparum 7G8]
MYQFLRYKWVDYLIDKIIFYITQYIKYIYITYNKNSEHLHFWLYLIQFFTNIALYCYYLSYNILYSYKKIIYLLN